MVNDGIDLAKYREVVRGDVVRQKLEDKVVADATQAGTAARGRRRSTCRPTTAALPDEAVKVRHILYSPKDDPAAAQAGDIPADDPSWAQAKADADAAYAKLQADPTSSTRSPAPRATRRAPAATPAPAACSGRT